MEKQVFKGKVLILGCGGVAQCFISLFLRHIAMSARDITLFDMVDNRSRIQDALAQGVNYVQGTVTQESLSHILSSYVRGGDLIVDLAYDIDCIDILQWCHDNNVLYINTSVEVWDPYYNAANTPPSARTLYARHMALRKRIAGWQKKGATAVLDHGANPGFVSHLTKKGLSDIAHKIISIDNGSARSLELERMLSDNNFAHIAHRTGVKVIHISERDTQIVNNPKKVNEFVNTWSVDGFYEEGIAPAELGWGTHERTLPIDAWTHNDGPRNQICLAQPGIQTKVRSWVPSGDIIGMVIRHGEAFSLSEHLTVWQDSQAIYRPTVHYAYCPSDSAITSLLECQMRQLDLQPKKRILENDIIDGKDELGVLLMGHDFKSWWIGSLLDINRTRTLAPGQNATTLQVASSALAAVIWMINNPENGVNLPDDLPHEEIIVNAQQYWEPMISIPVDWDPTMNRHDRALFGNYNPVFKKIDPDDMWQFSSFRIS